jgi:hypothetical protein
MTAPFAHAGWIRQCPDAEARIAMNDDEFWAQVNRNLGLAPDLVDLSDQIDQDQLDAIPLASQLCPVCGSSRACAYDSEGHALIHATSEADQ